MADPLITKKITEVQQFAEANGNVLQVQNASLGQTPIQAMKQEIVAELLTEDGVSLNLVNLKGVLDEISDLPLTANINDAYQIVNNNNLVSVWDGTQWVNDFSVVAQPTGIVEQGNNNAVSGDEVYKGIKATSLQRSNTEGALVNETNGIQLQTNPSEYGFIKTKIHTNGEKEFIFDLNETIFDRTFIFDSDKIVNTRLNNSIKQCALFGDWKSKDLRLFLYAKTATSNEIEVTIGRFIGSGNTPTICNGKAIWDGISKYLKINLNSIGNSGVSGFIIVNPKIKGTYDYYNYTTNSPKLLNVLDLNSYVQVSENTKTINNISKVSDAILGTNIIGNILLNKKVNNSIEVIGERLQNEKVRISKVLNVNYKPQFFRDGYWYCHNDWNVFKTKDFIDFTQINTVVFLQSIVKCWSLNNDNILCICYQGDDLSRSGIWILEPSGNKRQVLQFSSTGVASAYPADWNVSVRDNVIVWGEYAKINYPNYEANQSRYIKISEDYGETWRICFDKDAHPELFEDKDKAHIHAVCYDPYWKRIWFTTGDTSGNQILAWSDDLGVTWQKISMTGYLDGVNVQGLSMYVTRDVLIFGSDNIPNSIYRVVKIDKSKTPIIERMHLFEGETRLTRMPKSMIQLADGMLIMPYAEGDHADGTTPQDELKYRIYATYNGITYKEIWRNSFPFDLSSSFRRFEVAVNNNREVRMFITDLRFENKRSLYFGQIENM